MKASSCPICKGPRKAAEHNPTYPFCGPRCKLADLSNWMNGGYALPDEPAGPEDLESAQRTDEPPSTDPSSTLH
jgi:endogenous inhibitor of DNA gyrase (YacG/DUF329 family)